MIFTIFYQHHAHICHLSENLKMGIDHGYEWGSRVPPHNKYNCNFRVEIILPSCGDHISRIHLPFAIENRRRVICYSILSDDTVRLQGLISRFKVMVLGTVACCLLTVIMFILVNVNEMYYKWGRSENTLEISSELLSSLYIFTRKYSDISYFSNRR